MFRLIFCKNICFIGKAISSILEIFYRVYMKCITFKMQPAFWYEQSQGEIEKSAKNMVRFNLCSNMPEAEHCSSKIVDFTKKYVVEMVENEQSHS